MPVIVSGKEIAALEPENGFQVSALLTPDVIGNDQISLDKVTIAPGAAYDLALDPAMVGWVQVLCGWSAVLAGQATTPDMISYLPLGFCGRVHRG